MTFSYPNLTHIYRWNTVLCNELIFRPHKQISTYISFPMNFSGLKSGTSCSIVSENILAHSSWPLAIKLQSSSISISSKSLSNTHMHTHTQTWQTWWLFFAHTYFTHTDFYICIAHTCTHTHKTHTCTFTQNTFTHMHTPTFSNILTHIYRRFMHRIIHTHTYRQTHARLHARTHIHTYTGLYTYTHMITHYLHISILDIYINIVIHNKQSTSNRYLTLGELSINPN